MLDRDMAQLMVEEAVRQAEVDYAFQLFPVVPQCVMCGSGHTPEAPLMGRMIVVPTELYEMFPPRPEGVETFGVALVICRQCARDVDVGEGLAWLAGLVSSPLAMLQLSGQQVTH